MRPSILKYPRIVILQDGTVYLEERGPADLGSLVVPVSGGEVAVHLRGRVTGLEGRDIPVYIEAPK